MFASRCVAPNADCLPTSSAPLPTSHVPRHGPSLPCAAQVLSSLDVLLSRLTAHRAAVVASSPSASVPSATRWPPLFLLDPTAGEANYTQHLPDGLGALPALALIGQKTGGTQ